MAIKTMRTEIALPIAKIRSKLFGPLRVVAPVVRCARVSASRSIQSHKSAPTKVREAMNRLKTSKEALMVLVK